MVKIKRIKTKAHAKINLHLGVGDKRVDGFHNLQSIFARVSLFDDISIILYESENREIIVNGLECCNIIGEDTMAKAARLWCEATDFYSKIVINIKKNIPSEAGLGGGSSDAASILLSLQKLNPMLAVSFEDLCRIALEVGSDVPFFLYNETFCYVSKRGEAIVPIKNLNFDYQIHLVKSHVGVETKGAFTKLDSIERDEFYNTDDFILNFKKGLDSWKGYFFNDFERVIFVDVLKALKSSNNFCLMSGSGSTCYEILDKDSTLTDVDGDLVLNGVFNFC